MTENTRIYNRFTGFTAEDCNCIFCLHFGGKERPCLLDGCCCMEERMEALKRELAANNGCTVREEAAPCRG